MTRNEIISKYTNMPCNLADTLPCTINKCTLYKCHRVQLRDGVLNLSEIANTDKINRNMIDLLNDKGPNSKYALNKTAKVNRALEKSKVKMSKELVLDLTEKRKLNAMISSKMITDESNDSIEV